MSTNIVIKCLRNDWKSAEFLEDFETAFAITETHVPWTLRLWLQYSKYTNVKTQIWDLIWPQDESKAFAYFTLKIMKGFITIY